MIGICGASGYIGWELFEYLKCQYLDGPLMGTYCNNERPGLYRYDLRQDSFSFFDMCDFVVIAAGYAKIQFCEDNKIEAFWLNVYRTRELLQHLSDKGIPALFISSDAAERGNTTYGKYKRQVERYIDKNCPDAKFIRPGKINDDNIKHLCEVIHGDIKYRMRKKVTA